MKQRGAVVFDYGNNLRQMAFNAGYREVKVGGEPEADWVYPGFVPAYIRPLFCEGQGPFRWVALQGPSRYCCERLFSLPAPKRVLFYATGEFILAQAFCRDIVRNKDCHVRDKGENHYGNR